tara:strand:- start:71303 stop:72457 length:1155 start_codon:yes stop_codon:yes gene_type:complete
MALAGSIMIFYGSLMEGFMKVLERNMIQMSLGDIQIHSPGYQNDPDLYKRIEGVSSILAELEQKGFYATPRLFAFGLAASGPASAGVNIRGIDINREAKVTTAYKHVLKGQWLSIKDPKGVVIGRKLARRLGIDLDSEIVIVSQATDGSMANDLYSVKGILKSVGSEIDSVGLFMEIGEFQELMVIESGAHEIAVSNPNNKIPLASATKVVAELVPSYETKNWRELKPLIAQILDTSDAANIIMMTIVYSAVAMVILNATLMSIFERIPEFGVMKALGFSPMQIATMIYTEASLQAMLACSLAIGIGIPPSYYFQNNGLDLSNIGSDSTISVAGVAFDPLWFPILTTSTILTPIIALFIITALAVIYPGIKAALIRPVEAIHHQ